MRFSKKMLLRVFFYVFVFGVVHRRKHISIPFSPFYFLPLSLSLTAVYGLIQENEKEFNQIIMICMQANIHMYTDV